MLSAALFAAAACNSDPAMQPKAPVPLTTGVATTTAAPATTSAAGGVDSLKETAPVNIDEKVRKLCDLPDAHFGFNSASVGAQAAQVLDKLATCFVSGPAKGKSLNIVGHADPRGDADYNIKLGHKRAGSVAEYLQKKGVEDGRLATSSKGATEATGTDESGWAKDRKVQIFLADD
ncbi:MAG: OmpA family protein [Polyangiaceae bacterium]|nr:OmpA family protein [Polyangiaceae bacterium]